MIGGFKYKEYDYRIYGEDTYQMLVIKFIPNITGTEACSLNIMDEYRSVIYNLLSPINETLILTTSKVDRYSGEKRFFGEIIAGAALTVATSAQITAGVALYEARQNAAQIAAIKDSLSYTNKAIQSLQAATKEAVVAIQGIQDQINTEIVPRMNELSCELANQRLRLLLLQYYTDMLSTFSPIIQDPLSGHVTIQALSQAAGGNITGLIRELGYQSSDLKYILSINGIKASVIDADPIVGSLILQVRYPSIIKIPDISAVQLSYITYHAEGKDWITMGPEFITIRGYSIANLKAEFCTIGEDFILCDRDRSTPMSTATQECLRGDVSACSRSAVVDREAPRFLLLDGNLIANCMMVVCKCENPEITINQEPNQPLVVLGNDNCGVHFVDGIRIKLGKQRLPTVYIQPNVKLGPIIVTNPIDVSNQLSLVESHVAQSEESLQIAISKLTASNYQATYNVLTIVSLVLAAIALGLLLILCLGLARYINRTNNIESSISTMENGPTLAPKQAPIIPVYSNPTFAP